MVQISSKYKVKVCCYFSMRGYFPIYWVVLAMPKEPDRVQRTLNEIFLIETDTNFMSYNQGG